MKNEPNVKYPEMRRELFNAVSYLSGTRHQNLNFDYVVHILFDDLSLHENRGDVVGVILVDEAESTLISTLVDLINGLLEKHGNKLSDEQYVSKPEWNTIESEALRAFKAMVLNSPWLAEKHLNNRT